jgi:hypothetical protein
MPLSARRPALPDPAEVAVKASLRAADLLGIGGRMLGGILGVSEATVSRLRSGQARLEPGSKPFELAILFVRMFRSLDAIVGGDKAAARAWMAGQNTALGAAPITLIGQVSGLMEVINYLDSRRAVA